MKPNSLTLWLVSLLFYSSFVLRATAAERPNLMVVLADDLGYGDLACFGSEEVLTPNLDKFAAEGLKLSSCYAAAANCSPSRAGLMTGRNPWRLGIHNWIPFMSPVHVRESEITVATLLKKSGYTTCQTGKWHLNGMFNLPGQPQASDHGFDHWFAVQNNALPNHRNPYNFVRNGIPMGPIEGYSADIVVDETIRWLRDGRDKEKPFFTYVCFNEPHEPIASAKKYTDLYSKFKDPAQRAHHGNVTQLDAAFGRLMAELDRQGLRDNTLVFFTSDNGPAITGKHPYGSSGPLRAKKGHIYEGGIRVPGILRWPGHTQPGSVSDEPVCGVDVLPTFCAIAGAELPSDRKIDGSSFLPLFEGKKIVRETPLYWHFIRSSSEVKVAMREGDWKLEARIKLPAELAGKLGGKSKGEPATDGKGWVTMAKLRATADLTKDDMEMYKLAELTGFELYNLKDDVGESKDMKEVETARYAGMKETLVKLYHEVREESPVWPEWEWPRFESERIEWPKYKAMIRPPK